eukprot:1186935-Prorocentrum_minimum.AAC.2
MPALPASDWSVVRICLRFLRLIGPSREYLTPPTAPLRVSEAMPEIPSKRLADIYAATKEYNTKVRRDGDRARVALNNPRLSRVVHYSSFCRVK